FFCHSIVQYPYADLRLAVLQSVPSFKTSNTGMLRKNLFRWKEVIKQSDEKALVRLDEFGMRLNGQLSHIKLPRTMTIEKVLAYVYDMFPFSVMLYDEEGVSG